MGEAEVDEEGVLVCSLLAVLQKVHHLVGVPGAAGFVVGTVVGAVVTDGELLVRGLVAVALFAGAHGVVSSSIENGGHREVGEIGRDARGIDDVGIQQAAGLVGNVPDRAAAHDHVA